MVHLDPFFFVHPYIPDWSDKNVRDKIERLPNKLKDLELTVSTGPVVDFRSTREIGKERAARSVPLIQPECISIRGVVQWDPEKMRKAPFIKLNQNTG